MVREAIRQNSSLNVIIVNRNIQYKKDSDKEKEWSFYRDLAKLSPHVTLVAEEFTILLKIYHITILKNQKKHFLKN